MILKIDRLAVELPVPQEPDPDAAAAVQELLGGRFGEMSTLMNYTFQSFNFRGRDKAKPYYDLISNIGAEEYGHIELVSATINGMLTGASDESRVDGQVGVTLPGAKERRLSHHFIVSGLGTLVANSQGQPWQGDYVFNSGDLVLDLLHNFFLESGARAQKIRVYEMTDHPIARQMLGYLLVRGGVHQLAYAKALEELTGVEVPKLLNIPNIPNSKFPETRQWEERGLHRVLYRFSPDDYRDVAQIWQGTHPQDGQDVTVVDGPPEGAPRPDTSAEPGIGVPAYERGFLEAVAGRLLKRT
ncbi:MAG TPA: manganese catalase family protein [Gaiellaceae bacterium]|jgi:Mn-containing catalase|nr:manganese catalase family protein [Gaiellaceae bacterium]